MTNNLNIGSGGSVVQGADRITNTRMSSIVGYSRSINTLFNILIDTANYNTIGTVYDFYVGKSVPGTITNHWGIYHTVTDAKHYIAGKLLIGNTTDSGFKLDVSGSTRIQGNTVITGSFTVVTGSAVELQVTNTGVNIGNIITDTHTVTGSLNISGSITTPVILNGTSSAPSLNTTAIITQTNSGSFTVYSFPTASYDTAFFEYSVKSGSNARAGTIMAIQSGTSVNFTETTTTDFGNTTPVSFTVVVTGSNMALTGSSTSGAWTIKTIIRTI
jgi:hypothetical protein